MRLPARRREGWRLLAPPGALRLEVPLGRARLRRLRQQIMALPPGAAVVLSDPWLGSRWRCRRLAAATGLELESGYLALPTPAAPIWLIQDRPGPVTYAFTHLLTVPPGTVRMVPAMDAAVRIAGLPALARHARPLVPGRLWVGRRR
jgi:hypothetical protein